MAANENDSYAEIKAEILALLKGIADLKGMSSVSVPIGIGHAYLVGLCYKDQNPSLNIIKKGEAVGQTLPDDTAPQEYAPRILPVLLTVRTILITRFAANQHRAGAKFSNSGMPAKGLSRLPISWSMGTDDEDSSPRDPKKLH